MAQPKKEKEEKAKAITVTVPATIYKLLDLKAKNGVNKSYVATQAFTQYFGLSEGAIDPNQQKAS
jgi:hypothetical protein